MSDIEHPGEAEHGEAAAPAATSCDHEWELQWQHPKKGRKVEDCSKCLVRRFTDGDKQTVGRRGDHAPWVSEAERKAFERTKN